MNGSTRLILASASPRRRDLLGRLGLPFEVFEPSGVDESTVAGSAYDRARELARRKVAWVLGQREEESEKEAGKAIVIGADTLIALEEGSEERVIGKPRDLAHARELLSSLSGRTHRVLTGLAMALTPDDMQVAVEVSLVAFRRLAAGEIDAYLRDDEALGRAGAYSIQDAGHTLVAGIRGCYYNVVGLPLGLLAVMLRTEGFTCDCPQHPLQRGASGCRWEEA